MNHERKTARYASDILIGAATLGALLLAGAAHAADPVPSHPMMTDRFFLSAGWFTGTSNTQAAVNRGKVGVGTFLDFENDLGLDERDAVPQFRFAMRLSERWRLEADYIRTKRDNEKTISRTISFGDVDFPVSTNVQSSFTFEDARIGIGYAFFRTTDKEVGVGLGVHAAKFSTSLKTSGGDGDRASTSAPLPTLSVYSQVALTDRWLLSMRIDRLAAGVGDIDGRVSNTAFDFIYQPWRHFNLGFGYRDISMDISSTGGDWVGSALIQQHGPLVFVGTTF